MDYVSLIIGIIVGAVVGFFIAKSRKETNEAALAENNFLKNENDKKDNELKLLREEKNELDKRVAASVEKFKSQEEKLNSLKEELENINKKYITEFENIANKILEEKTQKFTDLNKNNIDQILSPLKQKITEFESKVDKHYNEENKDKSVLRQEIKQLHELNQSMNKEAQNLTRALKGDKKTQGNWGEMVLEKILERSGLVKDQEYRKQFSTQNDDGKRVQPDFIVNLPDDKHIIIDSKVSLVAYEQLVNAENEEERKKFVKDHIQAIKNHIKSLSDKNYQKSAELDSPDFVLLFIPIESSFGVAIQEDQELFSFAWESKIVVVSPSTLFATLKTISSIWQQDRQTKNAKKIAEQSGALYDKFVGFLEDMSKINRGLKQASDAYDLAMTKLNSGSGNLIKRALDIQKLGAKTKKDIPNNLYGDNKNLHEDFLNDDEISAIE